MKKPQQTPQQGEHAEQRGNNDADAPRTDQRASHVSSTDAQYGTHSSAGAREHAHADPARSGKTPADNSAVGTPAVDNKAANDTAGKQPTRGGAQTGLTGSVGQLDSQTQNIQRPGGANPSAQSSSDWQAQRGDEGQVPDTASEQARANAASTGRVTQDQGGGMRVDGGSTTDRGEEGNLDQARSTQGSAPETTTYPGQGPGEAQGESKYNASANEQDRLSQSLGGESLREQPADGSEAERSDMEHAKKDRRQQRQRP